MVKVVVGCGATAKTRQIGTAEAVHGRTDGPTSCDPNNVTFIIGGKADMVMVATRGVRAVALHTMPGAAAAVHFVRPPTFPFHAKRGRLASRLTEV